MRVLVVEDERRMAAYVGQALAQNGFVVDLAHDGAQALDCLRDHDYDAVVLDLMLPQVDGLTICRRIRTDRRHVPELILSARDLVEDRVTGLDAGADDYLVKPFAIAELLARVHALLRRRDAARSPILEAGDLRLDPVRRRVQRVGRDIPLTAREFTPLEFLMRRPGVVHTRAMIAEHVWDFPFDQASNAVDVCVKRVRDKLHEPDRPCPIRSVRGVGYALAASSDD